ncbi:fumarylpyruvate hydrolase [Agaricicola taiwanensis]|uniref:Fumarylpyruvate hydrolase n=1 Tax=Agaricicola taiwanensis TaxID=591372 RepID=A0A8J3DWL2_9RHOB|nr:fumarylacetoacetate hydrolase family protein [Agaricicola taiwanensis]GGE43970.1 fumarylpyruvate hydrolase [Agaricicola taiwanensis]
MTSIFTIAPSVMPVAGTDQTFPVRRIYCVGQNYADHAREMGGDPDRNPPFFFTKPADAIVPSGSAVPYPPQTDNLHHEIELVVAIGKAGADIPVDRALEHVYGYTVGIDLTRRDLQAEAKKAGRPWDMAKGFDKSAPMAALHPAEKIGHPSSGRIWLKVNDGIRQDSDLAKQIWAVPEAIAYLSTLVRLEPGDLLMTGTPDGVGAIVRGDRVSGGIDGLDEISITIA